MSAVSVSVVTPCFNTGPFLRATIDSIHSQGYPRLQHIVMDGGSTDATMDILKEYPHIEWCSEKDRGQSDALNKGFRRAQGEVVGWLNADDTYEPGAITTAVAYLERHPEVDAVYSDVRIIDEAGAVIGKSIGGPFDVTELLMTNMVKQPSLFMRRRVLDALGGVDERYHFVMDRELWLRMGIAGFRLAYVPGPPLANFRICGGTKSFESAPRFHQEWEAVMLAAFSHPFFVNLPAHTRREALNRTAVQRHVASLVTAAEAGDRIAMTRHLINAFSRRPAMVLNLGLWRLAVLGLLGIPRDRLQKFRTSDTQGTNRHV